MKELTDKQWELVTSRIPGGDFLIGVTSTGIFCRTGCPARTPLRKNVVHLANAQEALGQGFRPCKRCKPVGEDPAVADVVTVARAVEADPTEDWDMDTMAALVDMAPRALRQRFQSILGMTPIGFRDSVRLGVFKEKLKEGVSVTHAGYDAGYSGPARRHEAAKALGMTPSAYAKGGAGETIEYATADTPLGPIMLGATQKGVCVLQFIDPGTDPIEKLSAEYPAAHLVAAEKRADVERWAEEVANFLKTGGVRPELPLDLRGTAFQMKVWQALCDIPKGETTTYGELAEKIGHPGASRAVGSANGKNRVAIIVPCHLVVAVGGKLGGYAYGLDRKRKLLEIDGGGDLFG